MKVFILLCSLALARAGVITTHYASAPSVSTIYSSNHAPITKTYSVSPVTTLTAPAPVYESVLSTHESRSNNIDGSQQTTSSKTLNTPYASIQKYDSRISNNGVVTHSVPVYSNTFSQPLASFGVAAPVVHSVPSVTYTAHAPVATKTIAPITSFPAPVLTKFTPGVTDYGSHAQIAQPAVKITYSEAPSVSHMTFTGLGTSYSW